MSYILCIDSFTTLTTKNGDEGTMGPIGWVNKNNDKHIDQLYNTQNKGMRAQWVKKYPIPNTSLTIILAKCMSLRRMGT